MTAWNEREATLRGSQVFRIKVDLGHEMRVHPRIDSSDPIQIGVPRRDECQGRTKYSGLRDDELNIVAEDFNQQREHRRQVDEVDKDVVLIQDVGEIERRRCGLPGREPFLGVPRDCAVECRLHPYQERRFENPRKVNKPLCLVAKNGL